MNQIHVKRWTLNDCRSYEESDSNLGNPRIVPASLLSVAQDNLGVCDMENGWMCVAVCRAGS